MDYFLEYLNERKEEEKLNLLYKDTINLYAKNPSFILLIKLFTKVYEDKNLCSSLLIKFDEKKESQKQINSIKEENLAYFKEIFKLICENSNKLISENSLDPIKFYGVILCFLNNYDIESFSELIHTLYIKDKSTLHVNHFFFQKFFHIFLFLHLHELFYFPLWWLLLLALFRHLNALLLPEFFSFDFKYIYFLLLVNILIK